MPEVVERLLMKGADPNKSGSDGTMALHQAIKNDDRDIFDILLRSETINLNLPDGGGSPPLLLAVKKRSLGFVESLLARGVPTDATDPEGNNRVLLSAITNDDASMVLLLLQHGLEVDIQSAFGKRIFDWVLKNTSKLDANSSFAIYAQIAELLMREKEKILNTAEGIPYFFLAVRSGNIALVSYFLMNGTSIDSQNELGNTPLHQVLVDYSARRNLPASHPLQERKRAMIDFLIANGARRTIRNARGQRPVDLTDDPALLIILQVSEEVEVAEQLTLLPQNFNLWAGVNNQLFEKVLSTNILPPGQLLEERYNVSLCPICNFEEARMGGCQYMHHQCAAKYQTRPLFRAYASPEGYIWWCTICGRICNVESHHIVDSIFNPVPRVSRTSDPFSITCTQNGGGDIVEKIARYYAYREEAKRLMPLLGTVLEEEAELRLRVAYWNGPLHHLERARGILAAGTWGDSFPFAVRFQPSLTPDYSHPRFNLPFGGRLPTVHCDPGALYENASSLNDDLPMAIEFHHTHHVGQTFGIDNFFSNLLPRVKGFLGVDNCAIAGQCKAIHPNELAHILTHECVRDHAKIADYTAISEDYRKRYNEQYVSRDYRPVVGGNRKEKGKGKGKGKGKQTKKQRYRSRRLTRRQGLRR